MRSSCAAEKIRPPAVAGTFYPAQRDRLQAEVERLLATVAGGVEAAPKAVIAPHAGYIYSGAIAAHAFAALRAALLASPRPASRDIARVVVIGPAHYVAVDGIALPDIDAFETPLGRAPVDRDALAMLHDLPFVITADPPHAPEHALEVELPFLQVLGAPFSLVPLLVGEATPAQVGQVLERLWNAATFVISSDLSHYLDYEAARRRDAATAAIIEGGDWKRLSGNDACGYLAVAGLLMQVARHGLTAKRLALGNSGDTAGSRDRVVGYGAWAFA